MADEDDRIDILPIVREEAHRTIDNQIQTLNDIDAKAARVLRTNLVLLGIILTVLSLATSHDSTQGGPVYYSELVNQFTVGGTVFLFLSTGAAAITYTASSLRVGVGPGDLRELLDNEYSDRQNLEGLVAGYADWIEYNYRVNSKNAPLGTLTILLLIIAMTLLALGVTEAVTGSVAQRLVTLAFVLLLATVHFTGFWNQLRRWWRIRNR